MCYLTCNKCRMLQVSLLHVASFLATCCKFPCYMLKYILHITFYSVHYSTRGITYEYAYLCPDLNTFSSEKEKVTVVNFVLQPQHSRACGGVTAAANDEIVDHQRARILTAYQRGKKAHRKARSSALRTLIQDYRSRSFQ
jgi:hypothetical protein